VDFLLVLIELFCSALWLRRYGRKQIKNWRFKSRWVSMCPLFTHKAMTPPITFAQIVKPMNALQLCHWQFSHKETL